MTWSGRRPSRRRSPYGDDSTAYERANHGAGFDHDGRSELALEGTWPGVSDVEDLTMLHGLDLASTASESDTQE